MKPVRIGVVGPCAAGKTTLIDSLKSRSYQAKQIAQEHSYVPDMWRRLTNPDFLVYLDASYQTTLERKKLEWSLTEYQEQVKRLQNAREHADFYLNTDMLTPVEVLQAVLTFLTDTEQSTSDQE